MKHIFCVMCCAFLLVAGAQEKKFLSPDEFLTGKQALPKVLLVGSWHFNYPGLDAHKTEEKNRINIYSPQRQEELQELLNYIALFKPTHIVVESGRNTGYLMYNYRLWKQGKELLHANERSQIGIRLVDKFKLDTIYGVDAYPLLSALTDKKDSSQPLNYIDTLARHLYFGGDDTIQKRYTAFYNYQDKLKINNRLLDMFKYINSEPVINSLFGAYIEGGQFATNDFKGADALSMHWINRNLRIYRNIQKIGFKKNDRVLVIFGNGHIPLLRFFFKSSPVYQLVNFEDLDKLSE